MRHFIFEECTHPPGAYESVGVQGRPWTREEAGVPAALTAFIRACQGREYFDGAPGEVGQRVVRTLAAMHRSAESGRAEPA